MKQLATAVASMTLLVGSACAQVSVTAPWVRATVPAQKSTGAYLHLQSAVAARLVGVSSPVAAAAEMHRMDMQGETMKMRQVDAIELPAGKGVNLSSGTYHVMLVGLKRQLKEGDAVPLTLVVQGKDKRRETVTVKVPVKPIGFVSPASAPPMQH
ncbi:MAG: copper chaperone PCu(A)C [Bdellovibrionales bacterium]|nr:copper chaperone PCu(A)C [Massilia sp.]